MSSSAKYHKFDTQQDASEHIEQERSLKTEKNAKSYVVFGLVAIVCVSLLVAVALAVGVGVGVSVSQSSNTAGEEEGLTVISLTQGELEGKYLSSGSDGGIHFRSTVNDTHFVLSISTTNGELIVTITQPLVLNMTLLGINQTDFLIMKNYPGHPKYDDYLVPSEMMGVMESVMRGDVEMTEDMISHLDKEHVNETREAALKDLALSREAQLIIEAALSLGQDLKIMGTDYPSVMRLYRLALQLSKTRDFITSTSTTGASIPNENRQIKRRYADKLGGISRRSKRAQTTCSSNGASCRPSSCPFPDGDNACFGLCGKGCSCWEFLCGDCCVHEYCLTHDACCADAGFFSFDCFSAAYDFFRSSCGDVFEC